MSPLRAALVIARRDYVASVWSRTFVLFLIGPLLPLIAGGLFGAVGAGGETKPRPVSIIVVADPLEARLWTEARDWLVERTAENRVPSFRFVRPSGAPDAQVRRLLDAPDVGPAVVLDNGFHSPRLTGPPGSIAAVREPVELVLARTQIAVLFLMVEHPPEPLVLRERAIAAPPRANPDDRIMIARLGQVGLMFLTVLLTGMMLSNMVEEKSNKVIEVLTAAVAVDGIFYGKLIAMLGLSLTGIAVWGGTGTLAYLFLTNGGAGLPAPALGWPAFIALGLVYFCATYLLLGAVFLGIGAQAASVREVQTISMPLTMAQLGVVAFASTALTDLDGPVGLAAAIFPWSSPYAMLARAAEQDALWPHELAILWQAAWVALTVRLVSRWFRISVLKSGRPGRLKRLFRRNRDGAPPV